MTEEKLFKIMGYTSLAVSAIDIIQEGVFRGKYFGQHLHEFFPSLFSKVQCNEVYFASDVAMFFLGMYLLNRAEIGRLEKQVKD